MSLNQFDALFQTSIQVEFQSHTLGTVGLTFEGYEGNIELQPLAARLRTAFETAMRPYAELFDQGKKVEKWGDLETYAHRIAQSKNLISKIKVLYRKVCEKEESHFLRRTFNRIKTSSMAEKSAYKRHHFEGWYYEVRAMKKRLLMHEGHLNLSQKAYTAKARAEERMRAQQKAEQEAQEEMHRFFQAFFGSPNTFFFTSFGGDSFAGAQFPGGQPPQRAAFNPYEVLGVDETASSAEIKEAYRRLALERHPDKNPDDPDAKQKFQQLAAAYAVLNDPRKRQEYDAFGVMN